MAHLVPGLGAGEGETSASLWKEKAPSLPSRPTPFLSRPSTYAPPRGSGQMVQEQKARIAQLTSDNSEILEQMAELRALLEAQQEARRQ